MDNLKALGFNNVYNKCEDFYSVETPDFDVLLTNPPYSGEHVSHNRTAVFDTAWKGSYYL